MASMVALDQDGDPSSDANVRSSITNAHYCAVVMLGVSHGSRSKIITSRCATVSPVITKESYKRCNLKLTDREELAK